MNLLLPVKILGIAHMEGVEGAGQSPLGLGDADDVDMIGHKAVGPDIHGEPLRVFAEPIEISTVVGIVLEDRPIVISTLNDMVRESGNGDSG